MLHRKVVQFLIHGVLAVFWIGFQPALASCLQDGGREIDGKCYCVRIAPNPPHEPGDYRLKGVDTACPRLWGLELTFTNEEIREEFTHSTSSRQNSSTLQVQAIRRWHDKMEAICRLRKTNPNTRFQCEVQPFGSTFRVYYPESKFYYTVSVDPGVVEVTARPLSSLEWEKYRNLIELDLFGVSKEMNLSPHRTAGAGHMHMDVSSHFKGDARLFLDFIVDYQNHPYLAMCALGENFVTNPPIALQSEELRNTFDSIVRQYSPILERSPVHQTNRNIEIITNALQDKVMSHNYFGRTSSDFKKYQAMSLNHIQDFGTVEIRALRPQENWEHVRLLMQLFEKRLEYLKKHPGQVYQKKSLPFPMISNSSLLKENERFRQFYRTPEHKQACIDEFYDYVTESGLSWKDYQSILYPENRNIIPRKQCAGPELIHQVEGKLEDVNKPSQKNPCTVP